MNIAEKVKDTINSNIEKSQEDSRRGHLGASLIGGECEREIWFSFRWAKVLKHSARMIRLFNRGHLEEFRFEEWIEPICDKFWALHPETNEQIRISDLKGYFGGSLDGVIRNPCGYEGDYLAEFKTHSEKSFKSLNVSGVAESKPQHYTQMQVYLHHNPKLKGALYFAICKNDDELYVEYIEKDDEHAKWALNRAAKVIKSEEPLAIPSDKAPYNFYCKYFCDFTEICHEGKEPDKSCRTCSFVSLTNEGWMCSKDSNILDLESQKLGCEKYQRLF